jgi:hypothetical protein
MNTPNPDTAAPEELAPPRHRATVVYMDTIPATYRLPADLHEWLRLEAFNTRVPMNAIVVAALKERRARSGTRGRWVYHEDGKLLNLDPANLEVRESER